MMRVLIFLLLLVSSLCYASADLELRDLKSQVSADGKTVTFQFGILNHGPDDAAAVGLRLSMFASRTLLSSGEFEMEPLAKDGERPGALQVDAIPGLTRVRAELYDSQVADTVPFNNIQEAAVQLPGGSVSDLEIQSGLIVSEQPVKDKNLIVRVHLVNHGPATAVNSRVAVQFMIFQKAVSILEKSPGKLQADEERDLQFSIPIPSDASSTEGVVVVRWLPAEDSTSDPAPGNNAYTLPVALVARQADLVPLYVQVNTRGELVFTIKNKGNTSAAATTTALYLNAALVKRFNTPELAAGGERRHQYGGTKILPGTQITIVADFNADVAESSEENNRFQFVSK